MKKQQPNVNKPNSVQVTTSAHWQGPLPPPDALQKFDAIVENGAERVFRMAEIEQQHRIESERAALQSNIEAAQAEIHAAKWGLQLGAAVSILSVLAALGAVFMGAHWSVSVALVGVPIMSAVRALIIRK